MKYDISRVTPRPWKAVSHIVTTPGVKVPPMFFLCGHPSIGGYAGRDSVSVCCSREENAHHIVSCVNNFDALVEMVERLADRVESECVDPDPEWHDSDQDVDDARALLASLKEST